MQDLALCEDEELPGIERAPPQRRAVKVQFGERLRSRQSTWVSSFLSLTDIYVGNFSIVQQKQRARVIVAFSNKSHTLEIVTLSSHKSLITPALSLWLTPKTRLAQSSGRVWRCASAKSWCWSSRCARFSSSKCATDRWCSLKTRSDSPCLATSRLVVLYAYSCENGTWNSQECLDIGLSFSLSLSFVLETTKQVCCTETRSASLRVACAPLFEPSLRLARLLG